MAQIHHFKEALMLNFICHDEMIIRLDVAKLEESALGLSSEQKQANM
jgi:hypothetical protein